jgi:E3 ubiquitin-protein ligase MYCBP2
MVNPASRPVVSVNELPLKVARKCLDVFGTASFDEDANIHTIHTGYDEETVIIAAGKEFGLARTNSGKVSAKIRKLLSSLQVMNLFVRVNAVW